MCNNKIYGIMCIVKAPIRSWTKPSDGAVLHCGSQRFVRVEVDDSCRCHTNYVAKIPVVDCEYSSSALQLYGRCRAGTW